MKCLKCGRDSWAEKYCKGCKNIKRKATALLSQNKSKLKRLLQMNNYTPEWFDKFNLYSDNIRDYGKIILEFKAVDTRYTFEKLLTYWIVWVNLVSAFFIFELILISL